MLILLYYKCIIKCRAQTLGHADRREPLRGYLTDLMLPETRNGVEPKVMLWGTGDPRREFLHVDDLAGASLFLMRHYCGEEIVNVGTGADVTIRDLAELVRSAVGFQGEVVWYIDKPDGTPRKLMDVSRLNTLGWRFNIPLSAGIRAVCEGYDG